MRALPRSGFSTIGTSAPAARRASSAVGGLVIRIAGAALMWLKWARGGWVRNDINPKTSGSNPLGRVRVGFRAQNPRKQGHSHQAGQARSLHLGHQVGAVNLDCARADSEVERNLLV